MATNNSINGTSGLDPSYFSTPAQTAKKKDELGQNEFLQLLITQLKNQDPMDPADPQQFAVNLAQFSQLGELVNLNKNLSASTNSDTALASYLGTEVTIDSSEVEVTNHDGGLIRVEMPKDAASLKIELLDAAGNVQETATLGELAAGSQTIALNGLNLAAGKFEVKVTAVGSDGAEFNPQARAAGIVTGFAPGPEPMLYLGTRQVTPAQIAQVSIPAAVNG